MVLHMFGKGKSEKPDKYAWRGDADTFDSDALGPGHVPDNTTGQEVRWDSYNWGGELTNQWGSLPQKGGK